MKHMLELWWTQFWNLITASIGLDIPTRKKKAAPYRRLIVELGHMESENVGAARLMMHHHDGHNGPSERVRLFKRIKTNMHRLTRVRKATFIKMTHTAHQHPPAPGANPQCTATKHKQKKMLARAARGRPTEGFLKQSPHKVLCLVGAADAAAGADAALQ